MVHYGLITFNCCTFLNSSAGPGADKLQAPESPRCPAHPVGCSASIFMQVHEDDMYIIYFYLPDFFLLKNPVLHCRSVIHHPSIPPLSQLSPVPVRYIQLLLPPPFPFTRTSQPNPQRTARIKIVKGVEGWLYLVFRTPTPHSPFFLILPPNHSFL